ncbi:MAG: V-type ATP synthase subunit A [Burkholderiaceae bacterium]
MKTATVRRISGPVLRAHTSDAFSMREAVRVGPRELLGEVVRLDGDEILVQVYEDTAGLRPGTQVVGDGLPLAIPLGPGLLGGIFDGLLRPLQDTGSNTIQPGLRPLPPREFEFVPAVSIGAQLAGGAVFGHAHDPVLRAQACLVPPHRDGTVIDIAARGPARDDVMVCRLRDAGGAEHDLAMSTRWPVREPRPVRRRIASNTPLVTGQRILDSLFPVALGGKAAIPGGFGTGKTVLLETLAKGCNADVIVYLGCGERGNEMAGLLSEFPQLEDPRTGRSLMERTVIIANTSNMPVAAREASIYSAITVAEYFRDQGLHVALMADSTSRWAEALREVSGRFGELPGEGGYPAYLSSRLADFYERAAVVETLAGATGSVTVIGAISPPSGDFSEPVTSHTKRFVRSFWALDVKRAQARFYPAIHPLSSYSEDARLFSAWWSEQGNAHWAELRTRFLALLDEQARLERMARIIGRDALPPRQQLTLLVAEIVNDAFLRQSAFSEKDRVAAPAKQAAMMKLLARFSDLALAALELEAKPEKIAQLPCVRALRRMGDDIGNQELDAFAALDARIDAELHALTHAKDSHATAPAG